MKSREKYKINEVFYSLQGEGYWVGTPMVFVRFAGCNLECEFGCDTDKTVKKLYDSNELLKAVRQVAKSCKRVCLTGGEPFLQDIEWFISILHSHGFMVHIETNGTFFDRVLALRSSTWVTVSPKDEETARKVTNYQWRGEIKWLVGNNKNLWIKSSRWIGRPLDIPQFLQPVWGKNYQANLKRAIEVCKQYPDRFRLSLQTHKLIGVR